jgi:glycosyltransferase involved in cell wall biosynthesis
MNSSGVEVLGLFPSLASQKVGGIEASGRVAWQGILESGLHNVSLFCYGSKEEGGDGFSRGHEIYASSRLGAVLAALRTRPSVRLVLVWHLHLLKLLPFLWLPKAKIVLFLHGIEVWRRQDWLIRALLRRVDLFLSNSHHTWQCFLSFNPQFKDAPHQVIHLGIGSAVDTPIPAPAHPPAVLMISRLLRSEDYKGHREMIMAWPLVLEQMPDAKLWIAGDGDLREELAESIRARSLGDQICFWGRVSEDEKQSLIARCRCLALPSRGEGFGLVYLEAMRIGRPCLVSTLDAGREVIDPPQAGLATDPRNLKQVATAVCQLLTSGPQWEKWSTQARRRYESRFTAAHFQRRLLAALLEA